MIHDKEDGIPFLLLSFKNVTNKPHGLTNMYKSTLIHINANNALFPRSFPNNGYSIEVAGQWNRKAWTQEKGIHTTVSIVS